MKLERLRIEQFRKFGSAVEVSGLGDGLNVFHGPNEAGKSTLAYALRTLFFEKHKTGGSFAETIAPSGSPDAAPSLEAEFRLGGQPCRAHKTFLQSPRARLTIGADRWDGDEADEELARRLGFSLAGRGASRAETRGIPGLLWIEQGDSHSLAAPLAHARSSLQERLQDIIGDIASSAGGRVAEAVEKELRALRTRSGRATGVLADANSQLDAARAEQAQLQQRAATYAALVDQLARDSDQFNRLERDQPWAAIQAQKAAALEQLARLQPQAQELEAKKLARQELAQRQSQVTAQRQARADQLDDLRRQRARLTTAETAIADLQRQQDQASDRRQAAQAAHQRADEALRIAGQAAERERLADDAQRCARQIEQADRVLKELASQSEAIAALRVQAAASALGDDLLDGLRGIATALHENRIRRETVATRIAWRLRPGHTVQATGHDGLQGAGELLATGAVSLQIDGVGEIDIVPGGEDVQRLAQDTARLEAQRQHLLDQAGVASLEQAEAHHRQHRQILAQIAEHERSRDVALAGQHEDHWRSTLAEAQGQAAQIAQRLDALPAAASDALAHDQAQRLRDDAEAELRAAEEALQRCREAVTGERLQRERLKAAVDTASASLESAQARMLDAQQLAQLERDGAQMTRLALEIGQLEAALQAHNPDQLQADIDRFQRSLTGLENERSRLRDAITGTRAALETLGMDGIDEKLAAASIQVERWQRRQAQYQLRADALHLLHGRIQASQRTLTERLYAPLRERLGHYLALLFPGLATDVQVDELSPVGLVRAGTALALDEHSHGTREQLGVLARFAYADLLKQAGQPTLLVLDDALVHSDAGRLARMKRAIDDAASRHQILLFTCHPEVWRDAGASRFIDVAALAAPGSSGAGPSAARSPQEATP
ncbi:MAG: AAA family ATPase [Xanthomonadales bacterium]|nr:AAA family ATPase [Xanthomonadales bacterium]